MTKAPDPVPEQLLGELPTQGGRFSRWLGRAGLRLMGGWRINGQFPAVRQALVAVAPHTSNWDFPVGVFTKMALGLKLSFLAKHTLFHFPLGTLMRKLGGIPVDRRAARGVVEQMVDRFAQQRQLMLVLTPEGTRKKVTQWKTGFLHIARQAHVPVIPVAFDFARKVVDIGPALMISGDIESELQRVKSYFMHAKGKHGSVT
ncbi:lysophospholipid acyltransferase family protein [Idiomarina xiamenensis]|uniref:Acyltransferase n=1 Tax=Idiomarina xiamenensis 10-D-4 TaxID=740709 RepID=K2KI47_9GAMM|nr:lysophospholipid acyltransferase family protein [Idiomarina xiamenensis]EKE87588.1 acyltransferase [Idiomarina xiamenensis 10-D-4]